MSTALQLQREKANSIRKMFETSKDQIKLALPRHMTADRLLRVAMTSIQRTPKLLDCTQQSLIACIMTSAQLGLEPDGVTGQAYLIPYGTTCTLIPGYQGLLSLARRSGEISTITAEVVYEKDTYKIVKGLSPVLEHTPYSQSDPGALIAVYAVAKLKDGGVQFKWMWRWEVDRIRKRSKAANDGPWVTDYDAMAKKTVLRQICKELPRSVELAQAVAIDERAEIGLDQELIPLADSIDAETAEPEQPKSKLDQFVEQEMAKKAETVEPEFPPNDAAPATEQRQSACSDELYASLVDTIANAKEVGVTKKKIDDMIKIYTGPTRTKEQLRDEEVSALIKTIADAATKAVNP